MPGEAPMFAIAQAVVVAVAVAVIALLPHQIVQPMKIITVGTAFGASVRQLCPGRSVRLVRFIAVLLVENKLITWTSPAKTKTGISFAFAFAFVFDFAFALASAFGRNNNHATILPTLKLNELLLLPLLQRKPLKVAFNS